MNTVRILAVGIGGFAQGYLHALLQEKAPDFEIVGMVDVAPQRSTCYAELVARGVPLYPSMDAFYEEKSADLAIIVTPIHFHTPQILCALEHGSNVMCEKPLTGVSADEKILVDAMERTGKFVMIGYQWSYAKAILELKADITAGLYGKPELLKTLVLWPRSNVYYQRGGGWAGKLRAADGTTINDSVVSNATAHYLHNMLYVTGGADGRSSEVTALDCTLLRTNPIENFDTATVKFTMDNGAQGLFVVSHSTKETVNPVFEYRFQKGIVTYGGAQAHILGTLADGTVKDYGDPFENATLEKIQVAIAATRDPGFVPVCGVQAAAPQVRCVEKIQTHPIHSVRQDVILEKVTETERFLYVDGLDAALQECYLEEKLLADCAKLKEWI